MTLEKVKQYLENYKLEGDHCYPLSACYDFEIKHGKLFCYLVDSAEPPDSKGYRFGFYCKIKLREKGYVVDVGNMKDRYTNVEYYRSRHAIAEMLEAEVG